MAAAVLAEDSSVLTDDEVAADVGTETVEESTETTGEEDAAFVVEARLA